MKKLFATLHSTVLMVTISLNTNCSNKNGIEVNTMAYGENTKSKVQIAPYIYPDTSFHFKSAVTVIFEDSRGLVWLGSVSDGVTVYDVMSGSYTNFLQLDGRGEKEVLDIQEDESGNIWIQTTASLNKINSAKIERFPLENGAKLKEIEGKSTYVISEHWDVQPKDLWFKAGSDGVVARVRNGTISLFKLPMLVDESNLKYNPNWVFSTLKDEHNLWFGTINSGVLHYDGESFSQIKIPEMKGEVISMFRDSHERLWIGTSKGGLYSYDSKELIDFGAKHQLYLVNPDYSSTGIWDIEEDANGNIWFATMFKGALMYDGFNFSIFNMNNKLPTNTLQSVTKTKDGTLWIGSLRGGLIKYDGGDFTLINSNKLEDC